MQRFVRDAPRSPPFPAAGHNSQEVVGSPSSVCFILHFYTGLPVNYLFLCTISCSAALFLQRVLPKQRCNRSITMRSWRQVLKDSLGRTQLYFAIPSNSLEKASRTSYEDSVGNEESASVLLEDDTHRLYPRDRRFGVVAIVIATCVLLLTAVGAFLFGLLQRCGSCYRANRS